MVMKMNNSWIDDYLQKIINRFSNDDDAYMVFRRESFRHAYRLYNANIVPLSELFELPEDYLKMSFSLFLSSYFLDSALDIKEENEWIRPSYLFAGMELQYDFKKWISLNFSSQFVTYYDKYYLCQWEYQSLEKKWEMPVEYVNRYNTYYNYYKKQIILLIPIILLANYNISKDNFINALNAYKLYYSLVLAIDDFLDVIIDIQNKTLTPVISKYYLSHNVLPNIDSNMEAELDLSRREMCELYNLLERHCFDRKMDFYIFEKQLRRFKSIYIK